jgi:hypothetical protein
MVLLFCGESFMFYVAIIQKKTSQGGAQRFARAVARFDVVVVIIDHLPIVTTY